MDLREYQTNIRGLGFGKKLPTAVYVDRADGEHDIGKMLSDLVAQLVKCFQVGPEFNVVKFRTDELKISFLCYPRFFEDPHPALRHAITIDLVRGEARHTDYADNPNPPILHRKEAFLSANHPKRALFTALTDAEETAGLYGCGQGADVAGLRNLGYAADGWDPVHRPDVGKSEADVVNLGYVLNVIEDPAERLETIVDAFRYTRRLLVVSAMIRVSAAG